MTSKFNTLVKKLLLESKKPYGFWILGDGTILNVEGKFEHYPIADEYLDKFTEDERKVIEHDVEQKLIENGYPLWNAQKLSTDLYEIMYNHFNATRCVIHHSILYWQKYGNATPPQKAAMDSIMTTYDLTDIYRDGAG